jgi:hypothetical protein
MMSACATEQEIIEYLMKLPHPSDPRSPAELRIPVAYSNPVEFHFPTVTVRRIRLQNIDTKTVYWAWECRGVCWP